MNPLAIATQVVFAATGENIVEAKRLTEKNTLQDFEITTDGGRVFTVTVNVKTETPLGHFFEGREPTKARLHNFKFIDQSQVVFG